MFLIRDFSTWCRGIFQDTAKSRSWIQNSLSLEIFRHVSSSKLEALNQEVYLSDLAEYDNLKLALKAEKKSRRDSDNILNLFFIRSFEEKTANFSANFPKQTLRLVFGTRIKFWNSRTFREYILECEANFQRQKRFIIKKRFFLIKFPNSRTLVDILSF